jgi:hypothetical protein
MKRIELRSLIGQTYTGIEGRHASIDSLGRGHCVTSTYLLANEADQLWEESKINQKVDHFLIREITR